MPRRFAFAVLGIAPLIALAADEQTVRRPSVERGDCWSYRGHNIYNRGRIDDYELCVTFVNTEKDVILAVATVKKDGREIDLSYTSEWNPVANLGWGNINTPSAGYFKFPLHVGDVYSTEFTYRSALLGPNEGKAKFNMKVIGWEDVTVPAGTFRALRIDGVGHVERFDIKMTAIQTVTYWYVPAVNRYVRYVFNDGRSPARGDELTAVHLNK